MHKKSPHAYKNIPLDTVIILKESHCSYFVYILSCTFHVILHFTATMAEANGIRELPKEGVQSILEGYSVNDSNRSLPQVPNETLGLSIVW